MVHFTILEKLGDGGFSTVHKCVDKIGNKYACKIIPKPRVSLSKFTNGVETLKTLSYSLHVPRFVQSYEDDTNYYLAQELCRGGSINQYFGSDPPYMESFVAKLTANILRGLFDVHSSCFIHRDIKYNNILLTDTSKDSPIKIIDFGNSIKFDPQNPLVDLRDFEHIGTPVYMAPECLTKTYSPFSDIWSLGVLTYYLLYGILPFDDHEKIISPRLPIIWHQIKNVEPNYNTQVSSEANDFVQQCLKKDLHQRLNLEDALNHSWIKKHN